MDWDEFYEWDDEGDDLWSEMEELYDDEDEDDADDLWDVLEGFVDVSVLTDEDRLTSEAFLLAHSSGESALLEDAAALRKFGGIVPEVRVGEKLARGSISPVPANPATPPPPPMQGPLGQGILVSNTELFLHRTVREIRRPVAPSKPKAAGKEAGQEEPTTPLKMM